MDIACALREGLMSTPKYIPVWYRYDKTGSIYNDRCLFENTYYYFYKSEMSILSSTMEEIIPDQCDPPDLIDMGSGNSEKTRGFIEAILQRHDSVKYIPVDISEDRCRVLISLDITKDKEQIENAYLDPTGISADLYLNAVKRLNREYGCSINTNSLVLKAEYVHNDKPEETSYVKLYGISKDHQVHHIPGLGISINLGKEEKLYLHEGKGVSCKYDINQIRTLGLCGGLTLEKYWIDISNHVALCCFSTCKG